MKSGRGMRLLAVCCLTLVVGNSTIASAQEGATEKAKPKKSMAMPYTPTLGELLALSASQLLATMKPFDAPVMVAYDRDAKNLEVGIFGIQSSVDWAKKSVEEFRQKAVPLIQFVALEGYGVELTDEDITIVYLNRTSENAEVLRREKGKYIVAE
jgi:hypothetical protein